MLLNFVLYKSITTIKSFVNRVLVDPVVGQLRTNYLHRKRKKLTNKSVSIISNDCIGGIISHDMNLGFLSPTVNLYFETDNDYLEYLSNIKYYSEQIPQPVQREGFNYPIGEIKNNNSRIIIHFLHYKSFEEASNKWIERGKRINYNNLFIIWHKGDVSGPNKDSFERFQSIQHIKILITGINFNCIDKNVFRLKLYNKNYYPGKILHYKRKHSVKKYLDDVDYVSWINKCNDSE